MGQHDIFDAPCLVFDCRDDAEKRLWQCILNKRYTAI